MRFDEAHAAILFAEFGLLDLSGWIAGHFGEDDLAGAFVAGEFLAELHDLFFGRIFTGFDLDDRRGDLAEAIVGQTDDGHVLDLVVGTQKIFDLHGVNVFAAGDDDIFFAVDQIDESVFVALCHVAGVEPALLDDFPCGVVVLVVALHDARAANDKLADFIFGQALAFGVDDVSLPEVSGLADGAYLVDVLDAKVNAAGADGFGETVVGVILMVGKVLLPALDERRGHGLGADVHETPL